jgi:hypothetical protein
MPPDVTAFSITQGEVSVSVARRLKRDVPLTYPLAVWKLLKIS